MKRDEIVYLEDIINEIIKIENSTKNLDLNSFKKNIDIKDATLRRLEIIGEAVKNISDLTKKKYPKIEWQKIAGTRDVLVHAYFGVLDEIIWKIIERELPILKLEIEKIKKELEKREIKEN